MMKAVLFDVTSWEKEIWPRIVADYGPGVHISWVCKKRLGFTVRRHVDYDRDKEMYPTPIIIHLDFYDEASRTMFLLKYK